MKNLVLTLLLITTAAFAQPPTPVAPRKPKMITKEYRIQRALFGVPTPQDNFDCRAFLEQQGIEFPPEASATYLAETGVLVVQAWQEHLDQVDALIMAHWKSAQFSTI